MDEEDVEICSICLLDLIPENKDEAENLGVLKCNHKFHEQCIKLWAEKACTCPMDRGEFTEIKIYNYKEEYLSTFVVSNKEKNEEIEIEDLSFCIICGSSDREEIMLLCDICDAPYHTTCLGLNSIPLGNWYCPNCINENPALAASMVRDDDTDYIESSQESELIFETIPSTSQTPPSTTRRRRTRSRSSGTTKKKTTKKGRGKKTTSRTVANSNNRRIKASRSLISKLRKEILQRRQYSIMINNRLLNEAALLDLPRNTFDDYLDAYRSSTSNNTSRLSSLREKLNYDAKRKYAEMLDTPTVNQIFDKPSAYNTRDKSEYDMIWRQANLAKKMKGPSSSSFSNHSLKIKENIPSSSLKRPNIALRRMREQEAKNAASSSSIDSSNQNNNINDNRNLASSSGTSSSLNNLNYNKYLSSNNRSSSSSINSTQHYSPHKSPSSSNIYQNQYNSPSSSNSHINKIQHYSPNNNSPTNSNLNQSQHNSSKNNRPSSSSSMNNLNRSYHQSSGSNKPYNYNDRHLSSNNESNKNRHLSSSKDKPSSSNRLDNTTPKSNDSYSSNDILSDMFSDEILYNSKAISKDHRGYSTREIFRYIRPYIRKRVRSKYVTREQYKKLSRDLTYYVIKRLGNEYEGKHKLNYEELKEDFLIDHNFANKIIINFVNYNLIKFLDYNKQQKKLKAYATTSNDKRNQNNNQNN